MVTRKEKKRSQHIMEKLMVEWRKDWPRFIRDVFGVTLDEGQKAILRSVQNNPMTAVASGTARGKDFVAACAAMCFMYLTPRWNKRQELIWNTKVALTAPTGRQVDNIMMPEIGRLWDKAKARKCPLPGKLNATSIQTSNREWFLTGFKADDNNTEAWSGFHAVNTMFVVTEATGISKIVFEAIEGNLQGNSRLLIVFNPNITSGYAAEAMKSKRFTKFRLSSLDAENVVKKKNVIPGQVDYKWVNDKVEAWCNPIKDEDFNEGEGDFKWEGRTYRPNDLFRVKVLGMFPRVSKDTLIPYEWIELANKRWEELREEGYTPHKKCRLGADVAGMGRDSSVLVPRYGNYIGNFEIHDSAGKADHMHVAGMIEQFIRDNKAKAFIDTIGEGAGVYSRLIELNYDNAYSCKFSEGAKNLHDLTGVRTFANMRAFLYWSLRDWLDPANGFCPAIPPDDLFMQEATEIKWLYQSNGDIIIEPKDEIKKRLGRSPDRIDAMVNTFYPEDTYGEIDENDFL